MSRFLLSATVALVLAASAADAQLADQKTLSLAATRAVVDAATAEARRLNAGGALGVRGAMSAQQDDEIATAAAGALDRAPATARR